MFSFNLISDLQDMWQYPFMRHAFEAGTLVALIAGLVGYFVVLRRSSFAAHALSHIGFAGAAGAVLVGVNPMFGLLAFTTGGGLAMAGLGRRAASRDVQIGTVLAFMLGLGVLFISLYKGYSTEAYSLLFGEILGISLTNVLITLVAAVVILAALALTYRPLLFSSLDEDVAEAKGVRVRWIGALFMVLVAAAISIAVQIVGVLLIFALLVTPAAIAERLSKKPAKGLIIATLIALFTTWLGLILSYYISYPVSFFITTITFSTYVGTRIFQAAFSNSNTRRKLDH